MASRVGLVVVSHSARLAEGVVELAGQMAPDVTVLPAGGMPGGGLGTDHGAVAAAVERADQGAGVVLLYDLGSAQMTAEMVVESLADPARARVADAPLVEGTVAAAVAAQSGADLDAVTRAAASASAPVVHAVAHGSAEVAAAGVQSTPSDAPEPVASAAAGAPVVVGDASEPAATAGSTERVEVVLTNEIGLHARPAALLVRTIADLDAEVTVRCGEQEANARSALALMALGARGGDRIEVTATGPAAETALHRITDLANRRFAD